MAKPKSATRKKSARSQDPTRAVGRFIVVAIGASAGGIEATTELLKNLPANTGLAFVLVQHLDPKHQSMLTDLLSKQTTMGVSEVTDGMPVEPNHIHVIPPNTSMSITDRLLQLRPRE